MHENNLYGYIFPGRHEAVQIVTVLCKPVRGDKFDLPSIVI